MEIERSGSNGSYKRQDSDEESAYCTSKTEMHDDDVASEPDSPESQMDSPARLPISSPSVSPARSSEASPRTQPPGSPFSVLASSVTASQCTPATSPQESPRISVPASPNSTAVSPTTSPPASPVNSTAVSPTISPPASPVNSTAVSPTTSPPASPINSTAVSPTTSPPASPVSSTAVSPTNSPPTSPVNSTAASTTTSPPASPVNSTAVSPTTSPPASPVKTPPASPAKSCQENSLPVSLAISSHGSHESSCPPSPRSPTPESETAEKMGLSVEDNSQLRKRELNYGPDAEKLIAEIFGESDEDDEFEGFGDEDLAAAKEKRQQNIKNYKAICGLDDEDGEHETADNEVKKMDVSEVREVDKLSSSPEQVGQSVRKKQKDTRDPSNNSDDEGSRQSEEEYVSDFDIMMQKKKEENRRRRKRKHGEIINDQDDKIADLIEDMTLASQEDKDLNKQRKPATKKLKILPAVLSQLKKQYLKDAFLEHGILTVIADWISPLPDRSLPNLAVREGMIRILAEFPPLYQGLLKSSGVGRAIMFLYKHPKETKENREKIGRLISEWSRRIFNVTGDFHSLSSEERESRIFEHIPKKRRAKGPANETDSIAVEKSYIDEDLTHTKISLRPGDKGWINRAQVPVPSTKDYLVRPKWNADVLVGKESGKNVMTRFEKTMKSVQDKKRRNKFQRAVTVSVEGRKTTL